MSEQQHSLTIAGTGYVGLSLAILLAQHNSVTAVDIVEKKVSLLNQGLSPIKDAEIEDYLAHVELDFTAKVSEPGVYTNAEFVVVATPTNYDSHTNYFDTTYVENVIEQILDENPDAIIVVKSTVPVGYTESIVKRYPAGNSSSAPSSCAKGMPWTTTCTPAALLLAYRRDLPSPANCPRPPKSSPVCFRKARSTTTSPR